MHRDKFEARRKSFLRTTILLFDLRGGGVERVCPVVARVELILDHSEGAD